jgi:hypothetical protein
MTKVAMLQDGRLASLVAKRELTPTDDQSEKVIPVSQALLDYELKLSSDGKYVLTPLTIPDFAELNSGSTANTEYIDFHIRNRKAAADSVSLEVLDGATLLYSEPDTSRFHPQGLHSWRWDGYDSAGVLDTAILKSPGLVVRLTAMKGSQKQVVELKLGNKAKEVDWVDVRVDRNAKLAEVTVRPSLSDGGVSGSTPGYTRVPYPQLEDMARQGIEHYWSRNGTRGPIGTDIATAAGSYKVTVKARVNTEPSMVKFPIIEDLGNGGRSTSMPLFRKIYHNHADWLSKGWPRDFPAEEFKHTAAHEIGHIFLNHYGDHVLKNGDRDAIPHYSWTHKGSSTLLTQSSKDNHPIPTTGEVDLMHYFSDFPTRHTTAAGYRDWWKRSVAAEEDVKGLVWLTRVRFKARD